MVSASKTEVKMKCDLNLIRLNSWAVSSHSVAHDMLDVTNAGCVACDLHTVAPCPRDHGYWRQFAGQWGDWKSWTAPFSAIIIIIIVVIIIIIVVVVVVVAVVDVVIIITTTTTTSTTTITIILSALLACLHCTEGQQVYALNAFEMCVPKLTARIVPSQN